MRFLFIISLSISCTFIVEGQNFSKFSVGGSVHGLVTNSINMSTSNQMATPTKTFSEYADSVRPHESFRTTLGASIWCHVFVNKLWAFQGGLSYLDVGFQRTQNNIQYLDPLYPGIGQGKLLEKSSGSGEKSIEYNYHYQYLQIPLMMHYEVFNSRDFYYKVSLTGGVGINFLVNHEITANLTNFVVEGQDKFHLDSTGYEGKVLTFSAFLGAKGEYRVDKKTIVYVMPLIGIYPMSVSKSPINVHPYYFQLNLGIQYAFGLKEESKKK